MDDEYIPSDDDELLSPKSRKIDDQRVNKRKQISHVDQLKEQMKYLLARKRLLENDIYDADAHDFNGMIFRDHATFIAMGVMGSHDLCGESVIVDQLILPECVLVDTKDIHDYFICLRYVKSRMLVTDIIEPSKVLVQKDHAFVTGQITIRSEYQNFSQFHVIFHVQMVPDIKKDILEYLPQPYPQWDEIFNDEVTPCSPPCPPLPAVHVRVTSSINLLTLFHSFDQREKNMKFHHEASLYFTTESYDDNVKESRKVSNSNSGGKGDNCRISSVTITQSSRMCERCNLNLPICNRCHTFCKVCPICSIEKLDFVV